LAFLFFSVLKPKPNRVDKKDSISTVLLNTFGIMFIWIILKGGIKLAKVRVMQRAGLEEKTLKELYDDFQLDNRVKNLSEMTIRFYEQNLVHFFRFMEGIGIKYVREIEKKHIDKFIIWLKKKGLKADHH
jgi:hypothetical protein